ncbi:hypothetical protein CVT24_009643 [Panaeolus cyanescens]|uniref:Uncharacterized protein n=1 Tax=Panaeolus cyanescens TaxID=181874 RepID=A0A409Y9M8_9AGAR|nr:hypothetical protein CVT24_009643 [Panaeolus cyanescens]
MTYGSCSMPTTANIHGPSLLHQFRSTRAPWTISARGTSEDVNSSDLHLLSGLFWLHTGAISERCSDKSYTSFVPEDTVLADEMIYDGNVEGLGRVCGMADIGGIMANALFFRPTLVCSASTMSSFHSVDALVKHMDNITNDIISLNDTERSYVKQSLIDDLTSEASQKLLIPADKIPEIMLDIAWGFVKIPVVVGGNTFDHTMWEEQHQRFLSDMRSIKQSVIKVQVHTSGLYQEVLPKVFAKDSDSARLETKEIIDYHLQGINTFLSEWDTQKSVLSGVLAGLRDNRFADALRSKEELLEVLKAMQTRVSALVDVSDWMQEIIYTVKTALEQLQQSYDTAGRDDIKRDALKLIIDFSKFLFVLFAF